jgi:hypothetical protein
MTQPATYPATETDANAEAVARHMTRVANWGFRQSLDQAGRITGPGRANIAAMSAGFGVAYLLQRLDERGHGDLSRASVAEVRARPSRLGFDVRAGRRPRHSHPEEP